MSSSVADALFPRVRQRVLAVLFGRPDRSFYANELIALAQSGTGAVQRELQALSQAGLITAHKRGNQKHFQANAASPVFSELRGLVLKTMGLADVLNAALAPLASRIDQAFVFGSMAQGQDSADSDVDLMVVSADLAYGELFGALDQASATLGRAVNPTLYAPEEFARRAAQDNSFVGRVMEQPKIWLVGPKLSDDEPSA
jgi:predicted nucleotidyltransferase